MSATMRVTFSLVLQGGTIENESIRPNDLAVINLSGLHVRSTVNLPVDEYVTLDVGEVEPRWWYLQNVHDTADLQVNFGDQRVIILSPGEFNLLRSPEIPAAQGIGGASRLLYAVIE